MVEMMMVKGVVEDVLPCGLMLTMEVCTIALTILASTVMAKGISPYVFVVYTNAISSLILLLSTSFLFQKSRTQQPLFTFPLMTRLFFLGLIGVTIAQNLAFVGLSYSSPILVCGMANLFPTLSFFLTIVLRIKKFEWRRRSCKVKLLGSLISIIGALSITFYKGPVVKQHSYASSHPLLQIVPQLFVFSSRHENWYLGAILLACSTLSLGLWNTVQAGVVKLYPDVMRIAAVYTLIGTIQTTFVALIMERDLSAWIVKPDMGLLVIISTAIFGSVIRSRIQIWCMNLKGPFYVPLFKPFTIPTATFCGCVFFATKFHYGSVMGAAIVGIGYYTVMWGQIKEEDETNDFADEKVPLLPEEEEEEDETNDFADEKVPLLPEEEEEEDSIV